MDWITGAIELLKKILDFVTPWSTYWVDRRRAKNQKKEDAQKRMDTDVKKGDYDAFLDDLNTKRGA